MEQVWQDAILNTLFIEIKDSDDLMVGVIRFCLKVAISKIEGPSSMLNLPWIGLWSDVFEPVKAPILAMPEPLSPKLLWVASHIVLFAVAPRIHKCKEKRHAFKKSVILDKFGVLLFNKVGRRPSGQAPLSLTFCFCEDIRFFWPVRSIWLCLKLKCYKPTLLDISLIYHIVQLLAGCGASRGSLKFIQDASLLAHPTARWPWRNSCVFARPSAFLLIKSD